MSKNGKLVNPMKVITGPDTRWSYANVWEPKSIRLRPPSKLPKNHFTTGPWVSGEVILFIATSQEIFLLF